MRPGVDGSYDLRRGEVVFVPFPVPAPPKRSVPKPGAQTWKMSQEQGRELTRLLRETPLTYRELAPMFGVTASAVAKHARKVGVRRAP